DCLLCRSYFRNRTKRNGLESKLGKEKTKIGNDANETYAKLTAETQSKIHLKITESIAPAEQFCALCGDKGNC
ncbi:hypothetical protein M569_17050, partial [Genlisea aurea]